MDLTTTAALLKWIEALGFPTWALVILIAWISLRRERYIRDPCIDSLSDTIQQAHKVSPVRANGDRIETH